MYENFNVIILDQTTKEKEKLFSNYVWLKEKKHQNINVVRNEFITCINGARSIAQLNEQEKIGESVITLFIVSSSSKLYAQLKENNLLYASKQSIISKMKKSECKEVKSLKLDDASEAINIRKKKEYQTKPDLRFRKCNFQYRHVS